MEKKGKRKVKGMNDSAPAMNNSAPAMNDLAPAMNDLAHAMNDLAPAINDSSHATNDLEMSKTNKMGKVFCFIGIIVGTQFIVSLPAVANTTYVSGHITSDASWTKANSPYIVEGDVYVDSLVTLTIEPGVEVRLDSMKCIGINGTLNAIGTEGDSILISALDTTKRWSRLWFKHKSVGILAYCRIEYAGESAIYDDYAWPLPLVIEHNTITHNVGSGIYSSYGSPIISGNVITENSADFAGGGIRNLFGSPTITGNIITDNDAVKGSSIYTGGGSIKYNTITDTTESAVYASGSILIDSNNFYATGYVVYNHSDENINARYNYWGTASNDTIALFKIWDFFDDVTNGIVYYEPFLTEPLEFGVEEREKLRVKSLELRVYPNPFIQKTVIEFRVQSLELKDKKRLTLKIYDLTGRLVESFGLDKSSPYKNVIKWENKNLVSGIYFVKLTAGNFSEVQKVTILR